MLNFKILLGGEGSSGGYVLDAVWGFESFPAVETAGYCRSSLMGLWGIDTTSRIVFVPEGRLKLARRSGGG